MSSKGITRRQFIKSTAAVTGAAVLSSSYTIKPKPTAADLVPLGKTGLKLSRIGFGTGTLGGTIQRSLSPDEFNRLMQYAFDKGIRYFEQLLKKNGYLCVTELNWTKSNPPIG